MNIEQPSLAQVKRASFVRLPVAVLLLMAFFFWPAGTFEYWEAWVYLVILFSFMFFTLYYLFAHSPELLMRRFRTREREAPQVVIVTLYATISVVVFLLPGFDRRFGWSEVPVPLVLAADLIVLSGFVVVFLVFRQNRYTSRTVEVDEGQEVISTGPYAVVRHPMYVGIILLYLASPLALGSYWAVLPALLLIPLLVARILNEEEVLRRDLKGYTEYMSKTKYRLIPGIW